MGKNKMIINGEDKMKAIIVLKDLINGKRESFSDDMTVKEAENFILEAIKELEQSKKNFIELWDKFCETNDKLNKAKAYIIDLENQLKNKEDNGWMNK